MSQPADAAARAAALTDALTRLGVAAAVSADGGVATVRLEAVERGSAAPILGRAQRDAIISAAQANGFTHVALELTDAALRRAEPAG